MKIAVKERSTARGGASSRPPVALVLGAGGARGMAHIAALEVLDEMAIRPRAIAACSMGAVVGACYAAGYTAEQLRAHLSGRMRSRAAILRRALACRVGTWRDLFTFGGHPLLLDGTKLLDQFWPSPMPERFEDLPIPFSVVATDLQTQRPVTLNRGPLKRAVAASMAIPGLMRPVITADSMLIDGGVLNPLPLELAGELMGDPAASIVAIDVRETGLSRFAAAEPTAWETLFAALRLMESAIARTRAARSANAVHIQVPLPACRGLDFLRSRAIFAAADAAKPAMRARLAAALGGP